MRYFSGHAASSKSVFQGYKLERVAALLAVTGVAISILTGFHVRAWEGYASDFKTMYGSIVSMVRGINAYDFGNIAAVFDANGVIQPASWYAHAPVYPPFTLALMTPLAALPMVPAVYVWFAICAAAFAGALVSLARVAGEEFGLARGWRMALIGLGAAWPLASFGLEVGNVSVLVSSLCLLAVTARAGDRRWLRSGGLAMALLLKPHLALWVVVALLLIPDPRGRWMAIRGSAIAVGATALLCLGLAARGDLGLQVASYREVLHAELGAGSMSAGNHELMDIGAQILSLDSLVSFYPAVEAPGRTLLVLLVLGAGGASLAWVATRRASAGLARYPIIAAWCGLGLLATYHRAHDALVLLLLLPWLLARLRTSWRDATAWSAFALLAAMSITTRWETWQSLATRPGFHSVAELMLYRQAPLAMLLLTALLTGSVLYAVQRKPVSAQVSTIRIPVAAGL